MADLDGDLHNARVNGYQLKKYIACMMTVVKDVDVRMPLDLVPSLTVNEDFGLALKHLFHGC